MGKESDPERLLCDRWFQGLEVKHRQMIEDNDCAGLSIPSELLVSEHTRSWQETKAFEAGSPSTLALTASDRCVSDRSLRVFLHVSLTFSKHARSGGLRKGTSA